jgi:hypothetical protein
VSDPEFVVNPQLRWDRPYAADLSAKEGSRNCACAVGAGFVAWATRGAKLPTHHDFRVAAGSPTNSKGEPRGLSSAEIKQAYKHFGVDVSRHFGDSFAIARDALIAGHGVSACIDYAFINGDAPELSGQKTFTGGHHVGLLGWTADDAMVGGFNSTIAHDPLFDGRTKSWGTAPKGPQLARARVYRGAMGDFRVGGSTYAKGTPIGDDLGVFLIIRRAPASAAPLAAAVPSLIEAQLAAENADLRTQLDAAQAEIAELKEQIANG